MNRPVEAPDPSTCQEAVGWLLAHLPEQGQAVMSFAMPEAYWTATLAYLHLALRHPENTGPALPIVRGLVAELTDHLCRQAGAPPQVRRLISQGIAPPGHDRVCRVCGCTDANCAQCVLKTGEPCFWVEPDLCSACVPEELEPFEPRLWRPGD